MRRVRFILVLLLILALLPQAAAARIGTPAEAFARSPLIYQLQLNFQGIQALAGSLAGRMLHRYVSDDGIITVDLVVRGSAIEQQVMYLPMDIQRGAQVSFFLQDALGSVVGATRGLLAFGAAVNHRSATFYRWGDLTIRFTPIEGGSRLQVWVAR